ncbi:MAG: Omp28 family outer membrane lipoprotein [Bacteroidales bacterium]|nr:Omp28 family outer membrane lipoprotein [Bacteroidales bacterium]
MKLNKIFFASIALTFALFSCDIIDADNRLTPTGGGGGTSETSKRVVLIEEFTGQRCQNCPKAAREAQQLKALYGDQFIVLAIHSGFYAKPLGEFTSDFRTAEGNELHDYFGVPSYPNSVVNRMHNGSSFLFNYTEWETKVAEIVTEDAEANIAIAPPVYDANTRTATITVDTEMLSDDAPEVKVCAFLAESGIVSPQTDGEVVIEDYVHNHVLRGAFAGTWGVSINSVGKDSKEFSLVLNESWVAENCEIIAYVYNTSTMEILQVTSAKL